MSLRDERVEVVYLLSVVRAASSIAFLLLASSACDGGTGGVTDGAVDAVAPDTGSPSLDSGPDSGPMDARVDAPDAGPTSDIPPPPSADDPVCAASGAGRCYYVATDGDDAADGSIETPFLTFRAALVLAQPGDFIYARGGNYGPDHGMTRGVSRVSGSDGATSCPAGQMLASGACYRDQRALIALNDFTGWASSSPPHEIQSGTPDAVITVRAFPGELPVLSPEGGTAVFVSLESYWVIQGFEIVGTGQQAVEISGGTADAQTHHIYVLDNEIHDVAGNTRANNGIIRVNRGDTGGPSDIFIHRNHLHHMWDRDQPSTWRDTTDAQHFGAITTLSRENYFGYEGGGTGYIEIVDNVIHDVPMAFFFKNPMRGPVEIRGNVIHDAQRIGDLSAANVHMVDNLTIDVAEGWFKGGEHDYPDDPETYTISGHDALIEHNTFVGMNSLVDVRSGTGHTIRANVFFRRGGGSLISKSYVFPDPIDPAESLLQEITSDDNCIVNPSADYIHVSRTLPPESTGTTTIVESSTLDEARATFGFDLSSELHVIADPGAFFVDPDAGDYRFADGSRCAGSGRR